MQRVRSRKATVEELQSCHSDLYAEIFGGNPYNRQRLMGNTNIFCVCVCVSVSVCVYVCVCVCVLPVSDLVWSLIFIYYTFVKILEEGGEQCRIH